MVLNRTHVLWAVLVALLSAGATLLYVAQFHGELLPFHVRLPAPFHSAPSARHTAGGTPLGLLFGAIALLIFLFASALGIRRNRRTWPLGSAQTWLKAHIWLTLLTLPLVAFHCDFQAGGPMTTTLLVLYAVVMVSGFAGVALQQFMPRLMTHRLPREVVYEQIPYLRQQLLAQAEALRASLAALASAPVATGEHGPAAGGLTTMVEEEKSTQILGEFLEDDALPYLRARRGDRHRLAQVRTATDTFRLLRLHVLEEWRPQVDGIRQWCEERRLLDVQARLHHWLHGWLLVHVPLSFALLVLTFWHVFITLRYL